jgi:hypothetical protein
MLNYSPTPMPRSSLPRASMLPTALSRALLDSAMLPTPATMDNRTSMAAREGRLHMEDYQCPLCAITILARRFPANQPMEQHILSIFINYRLHHGKGIVIFYAAVVNLWQKHLLWWTKMYFEHCRKNIALNNGTAHIQHQCRKTTVLSCHRCLIKTGVEKMINI